MREFKYWARFVFYVFCSLSMLTKNMHCTAHTLVISILESSRDTNWKIPICLKKQEWTIDFLELNPNK